ncbi:MAG: hypothetical protein CMO01_15305 [Thalassobius sp.]|nr:hypothetical protein [Thalassovita sp.]
MFRNIFLITLRNFRRNKIHTIINLSGLSLGISAAITIFLLLSFLFSYDRYHTNFDHIYRLVSSSDKNGGQSRNHTPGVPVVLPEAFKSDFPSVKDQVFVHYYMAGNVSLGNGKDFYENEGIAFTEHSFFNIFDRKLIQGNPATVLRDPGKVVISQKFAKKYFGEEDPIGKTFKLDFKTDLIVEAVMEDFPDNTDFPFDMLITYNTIREQLEKDGGWGSISSDDQLYVLLDENISKEEIESSMPAFITKYFGDHDTDKKKIELQPLADLHFNSYYSNYSFKSIGRESLWIMAIIGIFLLITSCVNFINLSTALAVKRSKEVGIRKVMGSTRSILIFQLIGETAMMVFVSMLISFGLVELALYYLNPFLGTSLSIINANSVELVLFLVFLFVSLTLLAGLYPAKVISGFKPIYSLKNNMNNTQTGGKKLRQGLVVFQFIISQVFIIGTLIVNQQIQYLKTEDMGFSREAILNVDLLESDQVRAKSFKNDLLNLKDIENVTLAFQPPSSGSTSATNMYFSSNPGDYVVEVKLADKDYMDTYELKLLAGENITESDTIKDFLINESLMRMVGITDPQKAIGEEIKIWGNKGLIRGVVKDFHTRSMKEKVSPVILMSFAPYYETVGIKLVSGNIQNTVKEIEKVYKTHYSNYDFSSNFFDEDIAGFYENEEKMSTMSNVFALIAIFIGMLGLYGLIAYLTELKTKEIGIRKALGASIWDVLLLLTKDYTLLIVVAFFFAMPLSWWMMMTWLENYPYHIELNFLIFFIGGIISLMVAWITAGYTSVKAARLNPSISLRDN